MAYQIPSIFFARMPTSFGEVLFDPPVEMKCYAEIVDKQPPQYLGFIEGTHVGFLVGSIDELPSAAFQALSSGFEEAIAVVNSPPSSEGDGSEEEGDDTPKVAPWVMDRYRRLLDKSDHAPDTIRLYAMKLLVSGSRNATDIGIMRSLLSFFPLGTILIHGAAKGADALADIVGKELQFEIRDYPADWSRGKVAGPERNQRMLDCEHLEADPIDLALVFPGPDSKGTWDMHRRLVKAEIPTLIFPVDNPIPGYYPRTTMMKEL